MFFDNSAIIEDYNYYTDNEQVIDDWLIENDCERTGMVIKFCNEKIKILFIYKYLKSVCENT